MAIKKFLLKAQGKKYVLKHWWMDGVNVASVETVIADELKVLPCSGAYVYRSDVENRMVDNIRYGVGIRMDTGLLFAIRPYKVELLKEEDITLTHVYECSAPFRWLCFPPSISAGITIEETDVKRGNCA